MEFESLVGWVMLWEHESHPRLFQILPNFRENRGKTEMRQMSVACCFSRDCLRIWHLHRDWSSTLQCVILIYKPTIELNFTTELEAITWLGVQFIKLVHILSSLSVFRLAEAAEEQSQTEEALKKQRKSNVELENRWASLNILVVCYS